MATDYSERIGPASVALAGRPTSSTAHMAAVERADCIRQMLLDLWQLADRDGCIAAGWALEYLATPDDRIAKLQAFKEYVHARLDAAGVPADPESPHRAEGCRIGGRLDIVLAEHGEPEFRRGYYAAVANLLRLFDEPTVAANLLREYGPINWQGIDELDKSILDRLHGEQPREGGTNGD